jgi:hypothetical protein
VTPPHNGSRPSSTVAVRWKTARKYGPYAAAISGSLANAIQILTVEKPTTAGLIISGIVIATCLPLVTFLIGRSHGRRKARTLTKEIQELQGVLEATFGSHQPYNDTRVITFDIGRQPDEDLVEDWHMTTPDQGPVVYWGKFDAFSRGREHTLGWGDIDLHITRTRHAGDESSPQFAKYIRLENDKAPSALIAFAPPQNSVEWVAAYRSPGYWNVLRAGVQPFVWNLPRVSADDPRTGAARSSA